MLKVRLRNEGIYGIDLGAIANGLGIAVEAAEDLAAADGLRVTLQGAAVPTLYDAARARVVFHGRPSTNWYAQDNVYLVSAGAGSAMPRREPGATQGTSAAPAQVRCEEDVFPFDGAVQRPADFYYWNFVISTTNPASNQVAFALDLPGHDGGAWTLKVDVQGWSQTTRNPDHRAEFRVNGAAVGTLAFDDQNAATATLAIPAGVASNGANVLTVRGVLTNASQYSYFVVDGATAEYRRDLAASAGPAQVRAGGAAALSAAAFANPLVLAMDEQGAPTWVADANGQLPDKAWATATTNERFAVIAADAVPLLAPEPAAANAWFLAATNRIDYLVVAPRALTNAVQELADYRASQGLRVGVAVFEDLCDLLAGGLRTPEAIPALVRRAATTWPESPRMLLLAGNGHYDYLESMGTETNHLPPMLCQTYDGLFAADELLADAGGDELPDVAFGRLPACSATELAAMIAKIEAYEADFGAAWQNQLAFANDRADAAGNFAASIAQFTNRVQSPFAVSARINLDTTAIATARTALFGAFNAGAGVLTYSGHGTSVKWSSQGLLTAADVAGLTNARTPFVASLCCLAGHFEAPAVNSLAELLMQRPQAGAVAVWASSGLPLNGPETDMGNAFFRQTLQERAGPLGRVLLQTRRALPGDMFTRNSYLTANLLGDPALRLLDDDPALATNSPAQVCLGNLAQTYDAAPRAATATTLPSGLVVRCTYAGGTTPPTLPGSYAVTATVATAYWEGAATGTLVVAKMPATVALAADDLERTYDGAPKPVAAAATPTGLAVRVTYAGGTNPPTAPGAYAVVAEVDDPIWGGAATGTLVVAKMPATVALAADDLERTYDGAPQPVSATATPTGLAVRVTYAGGTNPPTAAGAYAVVAEVDDPIWSGAATGTLVVAKAPATVTLGDLEQEYDGTPRCATVAIAPAELAVDVRYDGAEDAPTDAGSYAVSATVDDPNWQGAATGTLVVAYGRQTIDFPPLADQWTTNVVTLAATASSGLPVTYAVISGPGFLTGETTLIFLGPGTVVVGAYQWGDMQWMSAPGVERTFAVALGGPVPQVSAARVFVRESGEGRFHVRLNSPPPAALTVAVARAWGSPDLTVKSGASLVFEPANWDQYQTVTLEAAESEMGVGAKAVFKISAEGLSDVFVLATVLEYGWEPNLAAAENGATIVGTQATDAALAIDDVHMDAAAHAAVCWTCSPPGSLTLEMSETNVVEIIRVLNGDWSYAPQRYRLEGSMDGAKWKMLVDASTEDHGGWDQWEMEVGLRYVRLTALSNAAGPNATFAELEIYGDPWAACPAEVTLGDLDHVFDGTPKSATATATAEEPGLELEITYDGTTNAPTAAGEYEVVATVLGINYYGAATGTLRIGRADQTIDFPAPGNPIQAETAALAATAASGLPVSFAVVAGPGTIENGTNLAFAGAGEVLVAATQAGDANWNAAPAATQAFRRLAVAVDVDQVRVRENGEGRFFVRLSAAPTTAVVVAIARAGGAESLTVKSGATRSFTANNWNAWQVVTLAAGADANAAAETATFRISAPGAADQFVTATALDGDVGENLALAASGTTISGASTYQTAQMIDGVHAASANYGYTVWTNDPPGMLTLDLQAAATVSRVRLLSWDWTYQTHRYRLESSLDGTNWLTFADASGTDRHGWDDWAATNAALRYLRFVGLSNSASAYQSIAEWEVYGERPPLPGVEILEDAVCVREAGEGRFFVRLAAPRAGSVAVSVARDGGSTNLTVKSGATRTFTANNWNVWQAVTLAAGDDAVAAAETATFRISAPGAANQFVTATTLDDDAGENLALASGGATIAGTRAYQLAQIIDGVHTSSAGYGYATWTNDPPGTLTLDLRAEMAVTRVRLLGWDWVPRVQRYRIDSSPDGTNWLTLADAGGEDHHGWDDWPATNGAIRYLRFVALSNSANAYVCVAEWEVWGTRPPAKRMREPAGLETVAASPTFRGDPEPFPLAVATSDDGPEHTRGWAAVDGDTNTLWEGRADAEGWYVAVSYDSPLVLTNVAVDLAEGSLARFRCLYSLDGADWREWPADAAREPVEASVLWLLFRRESGVEAVPRIIEIVPQLQR